MDPDPSPDIIRQQIDYYRARAPEYDEWWQQEARYDFGRHVRSEWKADISQLEGWLDTFDLSGAVLEIAAGTGNWTTFLASRADRVVAVDTSPESLDINAGKQTSDNVEYEVADVFSWEPTEAFGTVFFAFWLSHVPTERFADFWSVVDRALAPGGMVLVIDSAHPEHSRAHGPPFTRDSARVVAQTGTSVDLNAERSSRRLADGRSYTIVKKFWQPPDLTAALAGLGWAAEVGTTSWAFLHAAATRA